MADLYGQGDYGVRLDWGQVGARAADAEIAVVVDVLSFSTSVCVAVERGMRVYPYRWRGTRAEEYAAERGAVLAVGRLEATKEGAVAAPSLSPATLLACPPADRVVLPSPNGATITVALAETTGTVLAGCLRNADAVARRVNADIGRGLTVAVVAAGERWAHDDSLRPALEDHLGAGAIISSLARLGHVDAMSPEALAAAELFNAARGQLPDRIKHCVGGRELVSLGFGADVEIATDLDASRVVPVLVDGSFGPS